jgi:atypical dual specificity phosphatase
LLDDRLAGSARPGLLDELDNDLEFLASNGITRIVSLTRQPIVVDHDPRFEVVHFAIPDMGIPTPRACGDVCRLVVDDLATRPTLLHCKGGLGRTGLIGACCLVTLGTGPTEALQRIRNINPNFVQTVSQERFIEHYADWLAAERTGGAA